MKQTKPDCYPIAMVDTLGCRKTAQGLIASDGPVWGPHKVRPADGDEDGNTCGGVDVGAVQRLTLKEDEAYFSSYNDFSIHAEMLQVYFFYSSSKRESDLVEELGLERGRNTRSHSHALSVDSKLQLFKLLLHFDDL